MRTQPGVGYVEDHQGSHLEPSQDAEYPRDALGEIAAELGLSWDESAARLEGRNVTSQKQRDPAKIIATVLLDAPNLLISTHGLLFAVDAAALAGISMEEAGVRCAKLNGAVRHVDDLSHRHHIMASFLPKEEKERWLEIARRENLSASEFKSSLEAGLVVRLNGVTRAAISKSKRQWQRLLGREQCRVGKTPEANQAYRVRAFEVHHKCDFKKDFEAAAKHSSKK